jgi:anaerobic selenocysteine-containing dehydrogenase
VEESTTQIVKSVCSRGQIISVHIKDGKVIKIEGDAMGDEAALERLYHPHRLKYPQKRIGKRGEGKWERITWDEALGTIGNKLNDIKERYGAEFVAFSKGYRRPYCDYVNRLANAFGSPNVVGSDHVCYVPTAVGDILTYGYDAFPDWDYPTRCALWWGRRGQPPLKKGAKLIVANSLRTKAAAAADVWLQPRPATDLALALGMLHVIINEKLYDEAFVENWTVGFDKLTEHIQQYSPKRVEEITWVPAERTLQAARLFSETKPAYIKAGNAIEDNLNSVQCARALAIMSAITGNLDIPGGNIDVRGAIDEMGGPEVTLSDKLSEEQLGRRIGSDAGLVPPHPLWHLVATMPLQVPPQFFVKAILEEAPYLIKALCVFGSNPLLTWSNAKEVYRAFQKVEFLVVADLVMTPTAMLADIVLPAASYLEQDAALVAPVRTPIVQPRQKVAQVGESWPDMKILIELAKKLGLREYFWENTRSFIEDRLEPVGMSFEEFKQHEVIPHIVGYRKYKKKGFNTPSGKVEIFSSLLDQWEYDPLPAYHEPPETMYSAPELSQEYPLIFTSSHEDYFIHSQDRHLEALRKKKPEPTTLIHPDTAANLGINDGDMIYLETRRGRIKQKASLDAGINPKVVSASYAWWFPQKGAEQLFAWDQSNINILTDDKPPYNPEMGSTNLRGFLCKVYRA